MSQELVRLDLHDGVATITLNRPDAMNSLDRPTKEALLDVVTRVAEDPAARCVVLTGSGRAFCVGQDLKEHLQLLEAGDDAALFTTVAEHYNPIVTAVATMPKPVIAAVQGVAAGAGASLAFASDFRLVREDAGFNLAFTGIALSCDTGASWTLPRLVGQTKALELLYFPRTVGAAEALDLGLASHVFSVDDFDQEVAAMAQKLAAGPTVAYGAARRAVRHSAGSGLAEALAFEDTQMTMTGQTHDHKAAVAAFIAKEAPVFEGR